jgi:hypothetical protein
LRLPVVSIKMRWAREIEIIVASKVMDMVAAVDSR